MDYYLWPVSDIFLGIFCFVGRTLAFDNVRNEGLFCTLKEIILVIVYQLQVQRMEKFETIQIVDASKKDPKKN